MNQIAAMATSLLKGEVISVRTCFNRFGITNCAREIGRSIERKFGVSVSRVQKDATTQYGTSCYYFEYRLNNTEQNKEGRLKMEEYVREVTQSDFRSVIRRGAKTKHVKEPEPTELKKSISLQTDLFNDLHTHTKQETDSWDRPMDN